MTKDSYTYNSIDIAKFVFSILIVALHCSPFTDVNEEFGYYFTQCITRLAVPFFFVCNGFFAFTPDVYNKKTISVQCIKLIRLYIVWTIIYIPGFIKTYSGLKNPFGEALLCFIMGHGYSHLWYLSQAAVAIFLVYILKKVIHKWKYILIVSIMLYFIGLSYDSYYGVIRLLDIWKIPIVFNCAKVFLRIMGTTRNGLFFGLIFVCIGAIIAEKKVEISKKQCLFGVMFSFITGIIEVYVVKTLKWQRLDNSADMYIFLIPTTIFIFCLLLKYKDCKCKNKNIRKESTLIYLIHVWIRTIWLRLIPILQIIFGHGKIIFGNSIVIFFVDVIGSIIFAKFMILISKTKIGNKIWKIIV